MKQEALKQGTSEQTDGQKNRYHVAVFYCLQTNRYSMMRFKEFFHGTEEGKDIGKTMSKIPSSHAALLKGFKWKFHKGNTLDGDDEHVGYMDDEEQEIAVAGPWNFSREFTILHEVAHKIWEKLNPQLKNQWEQLALQERPKQIAQNPQTKDSLNQNAEEIFCHCYACFYSKHKIATYNNPEWMVFIKNLPH